MTYSITVMNKALTIQKLIDKVITIEEACGYLERSARTIYRYLKKYKEKWPQWLVHKLTWKPSNNHSDIRWPIEKYVGQKRFEWFWPTLLSEKLEDFLWYRVPAESLRRKMIHRWLWTVKKHRRIRRQPRTRRKGYGIMIQFDWSYHDWLEDWGEKCFLLGVDDATWHIMHCKFSDSECIDAIIEYWKEYFTIYGKPQSIYLDRHSSYKVNHRKDQFDHTTITRFETAMRKLWIHIIFANSPQWKWRVERKFGLLQDRAIKEMRLAWIKTYEDAEVFINEYLAPQLNKKFGVAPTETGNYHEKLTNEENRHLDWHFALQTKRKINSVWEVRYNNRKFVIQKWQPLNWTREVVIKETHKGSIQICQWMTQLKFRENGENT